MFANSSNLVNVELNYNGNFEEFQGQIHIIHTI